MNSFVSPSENCILRMTLCCDLTCEVISTHIQANRELASVQLIDPFEYLSNANRVHLSMLLPTRASQILEIGCIKIWSKETLDNILEVKNDNRLRINPKF